MRVCGNEHVNGVCSNISYPASSSLLH